MTRENSESKIAQKTEISPVLSTMPRFSMKSLERLHTCHPDLVRLMFACIKEVDFTVLEGHRGEEAQEAAFKAGNSKLHWPDGKHNAIPSRAVDIAPVNYNNGKPWIDWKDIQAFKDLAAIVMRKADEMNIAIRWGGAWTGGPNKPGAFNDLPHFEIK